MANLVFSFFITFQNMFHFSLFYKVASEDTIQQLKAPLKSDHSLAGDTLRNPSEQVSVINLLF